jgi:glycine dehydrogenase subunit 1
MDDGNVDREALVDLAGEETVMIYAENPTVRGTIEEGLSEIGELATDTEALFCLGSDLVALSLLEEPASVGADVVVGEADVLGLPTSYGMGLGIFATSDRFLRQVPGRLVGVGSDVDDRRAYTLTLQTREQHIRKERATSNICTNQAWVALRAAIHIASLGPDGLVDLAEDCVRDAAVLAERVDDIEGYQAPIHDRHHFREFVVHTDQPAAAITADVEAEGYAIHAIDDHLIQICLTETTTHATDGLVDALQEAA